MAKRRSYSEEDRLKAVMAFVLCGTIEGAARQVRIPASTIYNWRERNPSWWEKSTERAWELIDPEIQAKMLKVIQRGLDEAADRLDNGDERLMSNGEIKLVKMTGKDLNILIGTMFDKVSIARGKPTSITARQDTSTRDKLQELKDAVADSPNVVPLKLVGA